MDVSCRIGRIAHVDDDLRRRSRTGTVAFRPLGSGALRAVASELHAARAVASELHAARAVASELHAACAVASELHAARAVASELHAARAVASELHAARAVASELHAARAVASELHAARAVAPELHASRAVAPELHAPCADARSDSVACADARADAERSPSQRPVARAGSDVRSDSERPAPGVPTHVPAPTHVPTPSIPHTGVPTPRPSTTAPVTPHVPRPAVHGQGDGHAAVHAPRPSTPVPAVKPGHSIGVVSPTHAITAAHAQPQRVAHPSQPSHRLSGQTQVNFRQASESLTRFHGARPDLYARGARVGHRYQTTYNVQLKTRFTIVNKYYTRNEFRFYYGSYFHHGFYGGYYYPVRPCVDFEASFAYPVVDWFYDDGGAVVGDSGEALPDYTDYNDGYYSSTYQQPQPVEVFPYAGDYYPTDALVDMAKDVNGMIYYRQTAFRTAVTQVTNRLKAYIAAQLSGSFEFSDNDIFITHYEDLQTQAIVAEGFVDRENLHVSFKALLDLDDASKSMLFVPSGEQPTDEELATLDAINQRVTALGGDPYTAQQEPTSQTDGQTTPVPSDDEN